MSQSIYSAYLENEILHAEPVKLVCILYRAALEAIAMARGHLRAGDIRERSRCIGKAVDIVNQLMQSLDHQSGGDISRNLTELYAYVQNRLFEANAQQTDLPLAEAEGPLSTLLEAWEESARSSVMEAARREDENPELSTVSCSY